MSFLIARWWIPSIVVCLGVSPASHAQWAVVDVGAIAQLVQQVEVTRQQLSTARDHLTQAQEEYDAITGGRGMERLLSGTVRNYLPADWQQLAEVLEETSSVHGLLAADLRRIISTNAVLSQQALAVLSPSERSQLEAARRSAAMSQSLSRQALATTSQRFEAIQQLVDAIGTAGDQKAVLDLQARIQAEQVMLQNEATKLSVLYEATRAEDLARKQRTRELAIASIGSLRDLPPMGLRP